MEPIHLLSSSFPSDRRGEQVNRIITAALDAVNPFQAVKKYLIRQGELLVANDRPYHLDHFQRIYLIGAGKAATPMAMALGELLGNRIDRGIIIVKDGYSNVYNNSSIPHIKYYEASHPLPDQRGVLVTRKIINLLSQARPSDLVIFLISGGGSALLTQPVPGVSLEDIRILTYALLGCGASINEINTLRKHLDRVKGGQLARLASKAQMITLILSDVIGNPIDMIASGPTVPDQSTFAMAMRILEKYSLIEKTPESIWSYIKGGVNGITPDTPKPFDPIFFRVQNILIGSNDQASQAAINQASQDGFNSVLLTNALAGEASQAGKWLGEIARQLALLNQPCSRPGCLVVGGETTVTIRGNGVGGRNQEMALAAVEPLADLPNILLVTLATDGGDGPTDAAGAIVTGETMARAQKLGLSPEDYLTRNDSYHFFDSLDDLIRIGPTLTNVNDLAFIFAF